jgi:PAS domain S-box-containing protein
MESQESLKMPPHAWPLQRPDARAWGIALSSWAAFAIGLTVSWQLWTISLVPLGALAAGVSGWMLGARAGALFSLIAATLLLLPIFPSEPALATTQPENLLLALTFALAGGFTGRWRDTGALLRAEVMERRRAEAALQLTAAQEVAMLAAMPDLLFRVSSDGIFLDVRTPDESLLMAPPEDFLGLRVEQVLPEEIAAKVNTAIAQIRASGSSPPYEYSLELEGTRRTFEARGVQVVGHDELLFIIRDVTESRRAEAERQRLAAVVESSNQLVAITDCAGRLEFLNDAGRRLLGLDHGEEIAGRSLEEFVREEARPLLAGILGRRVSEDAEERELPFVNQSTGAAWRGLARPLVLRDQGAGPRLALLAEDLTERLAVEAGLARADRIASVGPQAWRMRSTTR